MGNTIEYLGASLALVYLFLAIRQSWLCWPAAITSSVCYAFVFYHAKLYTESALQLFFIVMSAYGWRKWAPHSGKIEKIITWRLARHIQALVANLLIAAMLGMLLVRTTDASLPWLDSALTIFSVFTTYLVAQKVLENWIYWIVIDSISACVYFYKGLYISCGLFVLYTILAYVGWRRWSKLI